MATVSTPVSTWVAQLLALSSGGTNQSASQTATVHLTAGWEIQIPIQFSHVGSISADPIINVFASMDGGATFDSNPFLSFPLSRVPGGASGSRQQSLRLSTGQYCIQLLNAGPNTANFAVLTALVVTAIGNN